jgi:hypothetical protein
MTYTIELTGPIEERVHQAAAEMGCDVSSYLQRVLTESLSQPEALPAKARSGTHDEFRQRLSAIARRHPGSQGNLDDSRESIYAGRGE